MAETGPFRLPGNLDPTAQEFFPQNPTRLPFFPPQNVVQLFPLFPQNDVVQLLPFYPPPPPPPPPLPPQQHFRFLPPTSASPTRALVLVSVPPDVSETTVRRDMEVYGEVRGVQMERALEGIVTVHFYDLRHAETALREIRDRHMQHHQARFGTSSGGGDGNAGVLVTAARGVVSGTAVWAEFVSPASNSVPEGCNQGTLVVFNLDPTVSSNVLKGIFQAYGPVREMRETPYKKHQRFVEFYDVRDAAKALQEMNGREIGGKTVFIEFSRPGGHTRKMSSRFTDHKTSAVVDISNRRANYPPPLPLPTPPYNYQYSQIHYTKKPVCFTKTGLSIEASMSSLSLGDSVEGKTGNESRRKSVKKSGSGFQAYDRQQRQQCRSGSKPWKSKLSKKRETRFVISEDAMADPGSWRDDRTTLMIKNIPNKYSQKLLLNMLDNHCINCNEQIATKGDPNQPLSAYDFVYLPIDFNNKCNVGYGFVNMTSPQAAWRLYKVFHLQHWEVFNSRKICEVTYARVQGLEALKDHFKNSKFTCEIEHYLPVVFSPPRDGRQVTEPVPIVHLKPINDNSDLDSSDHHHHDGIINGEDLSPCGSCLVTGSDCSSSYGGGGFGGGGGGDGGGGGEKLGKGSINLVAA